VQQQGVGSPAILVVGDVVQASPMWAAQGQGIDAPLHAGCALPARRLVG
jgi:hypothetical protein